MKKLVLAAAFTAAASAGFAGSPEPAAMEPAVMVEEATGSSTGAMLPLVLLALLVVALD